MENAHDPQLPSLTNVGTPFLLVDESVFLANIARLRARIGSFNVALRPHLKTAKSIEAANLILADRLSPLTVSTLREAEVFAEAGYRNILYAVGIVPQKLARVAKLIKTGVEMAVILDSLEQAEAVNKASMEHEVAITALIEIDCDGHRGGILAESEALLMIGKSLHDGAASMGGVLTHAGESYKAKSEQDLIDAAEAERLSIDMAAKRLREAGIPCAICSVGSTPTAHFAKNLDGITEVRAGVYVFFDLVMLGLGVCGVNDIALSVVSSVIGKNERKGWLLVDAGWTALSKDRGRELDHGRNGYGLVCNAEGEVLEDLIVFELNQEHGIIALREGSSETLPDLPIGTRLRILPNHACATASQFRGYHVLAAEHPGKLSFWPRISGW